jgi:hypothetical protein
MEQIVQGTPREMRKKYEELWTEKDKFYLDAASLQEPDPFDVCALHSARFFLCLSYFVGASFVSIHWISSCRRMIHFRKNIHRSICPRTKALAKR